MLHQHMQAMKDGGMMGGGMMGQSKMEGGMKGG